MNKAIITQEIKKKCLIQCAKIKLNLKILFIDFIQDKLMKKLKWFLIIKKMYFNR